MEFPPGGGFPPSLVQSGLTLTDLASRGKTSPAENSFYRTVRETCIIIPLVRVGLSTLPPGVCHGDSEPSRLEN
jgi:hypothetical protein